MRKQLSIYARFYNDFNMVRVLVPTGQNYVEAGVIEDLTEAAENIGFIRFRCESKNSTFDVVFIQFRSYVDLASFKEFLVASYEL